MFAGEVWWSFFVVVVGIVYRCAISWNAAKIDRLINSSNWINVSDWFIIFQMVDRIDLIACSRVLCVEREAPHLCVDASSLKRLRSYKFVRIINILYSVHFFYEARNVLRNKSYCRSQNICKVGSSAGPASFFSFFFFVLWGDFLDWSFCMQKCHRSIR